MKLRLVRRYKATHIYCSNGSIINPSKEDIVRFLTEFKKPNIFKGSDGFWRNNIADMEDAPGETIAFVDDTNRLVILDGSLFNDLFEKEVKYVSASEYAERHSKCRATVKNLCVAGKLEGAYKTSSGWLIPENAPYPEDGRHTRKTKIK